MKISTVTSFIICILTFLTSCGSPSGSSSGHGENSIYYWRTTFTLNETERDFLRKHAIRKIYIRCLDVDCDKKSGKGFEVIPDGTLRFIDSILMNYKEESPTSTQLAAYVRSRCDNYYDYSLQKR